MIVSGKYAKTAVLYVDDDQENLESFKAVFRRDYDIHLANSASEAMRILEQTTIQVLITDQRMPEMTGSELLEKLADNYPDMLRYILTGFSDFDPLVSALNDGRLQGYFSKPLDPEIIKHRIEDGMTLYHLKKENEKLNISLKESEQKIRIQLAELEQVYTTAPVGLILVDKDLQIIRINEKLAEIDGLIVADHLGKNLYDVVPELYGQLKEIYQPVLETGTPAINIAIHGTTRAQPGIERDWLGSYYPFINNDGEIEGVIGGVIEITELKQAEKTAQDARLFTESLLQTTNAMIVVLDMEGTIQLINPKVEELTGYRSKELLGQNWFDCIVPRKTYPQVYEEFTRFKGDNSAQISENPIVTKNDTERIISWSKSKLRENSADVGILFVGIDITEGKIAEAEKERLASQLQQAQKMETIGTLSGGIAHDFNNILTCILGFGDLALTSVEKGSGVEADRREILAAGNRAKQLVRQILTIARKTDEEVQPMRIDTLLKETIKFIRSSIPTSIEIQQNVESDSLIMANETQIHQVLMNLCTNAAHAMEEQEGLLSISLRDVHVDKSSAPYKNGLAPGNYIELEISDTGVGISPDIIDSIFEPYFTTKGPGEGTGIGLALVHSIVESYGGRVFVRSEVGKGTVFTVYFLITVTRNSCDQYEQGELPLGTERIMCVDDEAPITRMCSQLLQSLGYVVTSRTSGLEALELFRSSPDEFDLIITDMTMPKISGVNLAIELMNIKPDIPVIICTGYSKNFSKEKAFEIGIKAFITKPFNKAELATTIREVLDKA